MSANHCYCESMPDNRSCDFCNGYRHPEAVELYCPAVMRDVSRQLCVSKTDLAKMPGDLVRTLVDTTPYINEVRVRYPSSYNEHVRAGRIVES